MAMGIPLPQTGWTPWAQGVGLGHEQQKIGASKKMNALEAYLKMQKEGREQEMHPLDILAKKLGIDEKRLATDPEFRMKFYNKAMEMMGFPQEGQSSQGENPAAPAMGAQPGQGAPQPPQEGIDPNRLDTELPNQNPAEAASLEQSQGAPSMQGANVTEDKSNPTQVSLAQHFAQLATQYNKMNPQNPISTDVNDVHSQEVLRDAFRKANPVSPPDKTGEQVRLAGNNAQTQSINGQPNAANAPQYPALAKKMGNKPNWAAIQKNPMATGMFKPLGIDIKAATSETPGEKRENDYQTAVQLEKQRLQNQKDLAQYNLSLEEKKAEAKGMGAFKSKYYAEAVMAGDAMEAKKADLDMMIKAIENNPHPEQVIGPFNSKLATLFGNPKDQALAGEMVAHAGNLVVDTMKGIGGQGSAKEIGQIGAYKTNPTDPYFVMLGKLKANAELMEIARQRAHIKVQMMDQGKSASEAADIAVARTPINGITNKYGKVLENAERRVGLQHGRIPRFHSKEEGHEFLISITPSEIRHLRELQAMEGK